MSALQWLEGSDGHDFMMLPVDLLITSTGEAADIGLDKANRPPCPYHGGFHEGCIYVSSVERGYVFIGPNDCIWSVACHGQMSRLPVLIDFAPLNLQQALFWLACYIYIYIIYVCMYVYIYIYIYIYIYVYTYICLNTAIFDEMGQAWTHRWRCGWAPSAWRRWRWMPRMELPSGRNIDSMGVSRGSQT